MNKFKTFLQTMCLLLLSHMIVNAGEADMEFEEFKAWLLAPLSPEPARTAEEQIKYDQELQDMVHLFQYGPTPPSSSPIPLPLIEPLAPADRRPQAMVLDSPRPLHKTTHTVPDFFQPKVEPVATSLTPDRSSATSSLTIPLGRTASIRGATALAIKEMCRSFTEFQNLYGKFTERPTLEQMQFEIALHSLTVTSLKSLEIYQRPKYGTGACVVQLPTGKTNFLSEASDLAREYLKYHHLTFDQLTDRQIIKIHQSLKEKLSGAKITFRSDY